MEAAGGGGHVARLAAPLPLLLLLLLASACGGSARGSPATGHGAATPEEAAALFLRSLGRLPEDARTEAASPELASRLAAAIRAVSQGHGRLDIEVEPLGSPRFVVGGGDRRLVGMVARLAMREAAPDGALLRQLDVDRYDFILTVERRGDRWAVAAMTPLPWVGDGEALEEGGCPLIGGDNHRFQRLREMRRQDVLQLPITADEMKAIEEAWRCYWLVTSHAFRRLDDALLPQVSGGGQLERDLEMVRARRQHGTALEEEAVHRSPVLVQYVGKMATVDEWFDGRGRGISSSTGEPLAEWQYKAGHLTFRLEKRDGRWVVTFHAFVAGPGGREPGQGERGTEVVTP
jgi:hypothetical protein